LYTYFWVNKKTDARVGKPGFQVPPGVEKIGALTILENGVGLKKKSPGQLVFDKLG
jgi:hypothetical protein